MATTAQDNIIKTLGGGPIKSVTYPLDSSGGNDFNQGDLLWWDSATNFAKPIAAAANSATFIGVALKSAYQALYTKASTGAANKVYEPAALVGIGCIVSLKTTAAETYNDGTLVYVGADAQTITTVAGTSTSIGVVKLRNGQSAVTGAAGTNIDVLLTVKTPIASL